MARTMEGETELKRMQGESGPRNDESAGFLKELEIAKALSMETLELDRIRRERHMAEQRSRQVVLLAGGRRNNAGSENELSTPSPQPAAGGETAKKMTAGAECPVTTKVDPRSRPRPGQPSKPSLPLKVLPPPPRRQTSQSSVASLDSPDLMSFAGPDDSAPKPPEGVDFDPLLLSLAFEAQPPPVPKPPSAAFRNLPFAAFDSPPATAVQPSLQGPLPLGQWNFPPPVVPRGGGGSFQPPRPFVAPPAMPPRPVPAAPAKGRISLSAVPPAPAPSTYVASAADGDVVFRAIEKRSNGNLIDLSFFDVFGGAAAANGRLDAAMDSEDLLRSFDPLHAEEEGFKRRPGAAAPGGEIGGQYYKLWESGSAFDFGEEDEFRCYAAEDDGPDPAAPPVPTRKQSKCDHREPDDATAAAAAAAAVAVELRHGKSGARGSSYYQRCSRVYKSQKAMSRTTVAAISEYEAFRDMLVRLRGGFAHDDVLTNAGLVISPNLESLQVEETSVKLCIYSAFAEDRPVQFACDVNTSVEHVISQIACMLFDDITSIVLENYVLKVHGRTEYFSTESALIDYEYVHHCLKFDEVVRITFLDTDTLLKPLARTARDDETDIDIAVSRLIPQASHAVSPHVLSILLETLEKEIDKVKTDAAEGRAKTLHYVGLVQALKAICSKVYEVESKEFLESVQSLMRLVNYFLTVPVFEDLPSDREAEYMSKIDARTSFEDVKKMPSCPNIRMNLLHLTLEKVNEAVRLLLKTYCRCFFVNYEVPMLTSTHSVKDITAYDHIFSFRVYSVHSIKKLPLNTSFDSFVVGCEIYHGTRLLAGPVDTKPAALTTCFYEHILFDEWIEMSSLSLCILPRESRLCCTLYGITSASADSKTNEGIQQETREELGWAAFQIFDYNGEMLQGNAMCGMWSPNVDKWLGPAVCNVEDPKAPVMLICLPEFDTTVIFAPVLEDNHSRTSHSLKRDFALLDSGTQQRLMDIVEKLPYSSNIVEDRETIWSMRYYLYEFPQALPKVLLAAHSWDWSCLPDIYHMMNEWKPMEPIDALELLLPCFPDLEVRKTAISWMKNMSSDELCDYLPQLVQALKFEAYEDSPTASFLLERSLTCIRVMHHLYWLLKQNLDDPHFSRRIHLVMNSLKAIAGKALRERMDDQETLMKKLTDVGKKIKETKESLRASTLENALQSTNGFLEDNPTCLPLSPSLEVCGVNINLCSYFPSNALPLKLSFKSIEGGAKPIEAIFKNGDDLRQDMLTLQMIRIMDKLWLKEGLNLKIVTFCCIPTATKTGILEMVREAETLRKIQTEHGLTGSFKDHPIADWLHKYNIPDVEYQQAVENFTLSCAGYSVATYILGICDRHNDNIMIKTSGHIFHIDFGKFLGDSQKLGGIKRDRVPFVLTSDMAYVINGGDKPTDKFHSFVDVCCQAFNAIRKHGNLFLHLFSLMVSAGIPGVTMEAVSYIQKALLPDKSENEASMIFAKMIQDSLKSWSTQINFFIHNLAQMRFTGEQACDTLLSFVPRTYTMQNDSKIEKMDVVGYQKLYDPEKYYVYIIKVRRRVGGESFLFRSYSEFCEFHEKLCAGFPLAKYRSLRRAYLRRSNIRQVAEKRKAEIDQFLQTLWGMADEIKHCDLVYTFFHPLQRDLQEDLQKGSSTVTIDSSNWRSNCQDGFVTGEVKLAIHYKNDSLFVMIMHARNLNGVKGQDPDPYVKTYLIPDVTKTTKRKTKVARKTCHPTFMEMMVYGMPLTAVKQRVLQVSIWNSGRVAENIFLGAVDIDLGDLELTKQTTKWYQLGNLTNLLHR